MARTLAPVGALLLSVALLLTGHGLQSIVLPLRGELESFSSLDLGILGSSYFAGFVAGCLTGPRLVLRAGHIRVFVAMVSLASAIALAHPLLVSAVPWFVFRAGTGFSLSILYLVIESWLNERATNANRGLVMSSYIIVNFTALTIGQMLLTTGAPQGFAMFAIASILVSLAAIPVALTRSEQPAPISLVRVRPVQLYRTSPVGVVGVFLIGAANSSLFALGPIYATGRGLTTNQAALFMSIVVVAGALLQWPVGRASDRVDRRHVLVGILVLAAAVGIVMATPLVTAGWPLIVAAFAFGAFAMPCYAVAAAHAYDHADPRTYVETSAGLLLSNGVGSIIGPTIAAALVSGMGPAGLFAFTAAVHLILASFVTWRARVRSGLASEEKTGFDLASTAPVGGPITPEPLDEADPNVVVPPAPDAPVAAEEPETTSPPGS